VTSAHRGWPITRLFDNADGELQQGERNGDRLPYYASIDVRGEYWHPAWDGTVAYSLEISNALNRRNVCCSELALSSTDLDTARIVSRERGWRPLIPLLSVRWER
jgi:hypothetical protein